MWSPIHNDMDIDDDYGFFYEEDDNSIVAAAPRIRLSTQQEKSKRDDFHSHSLGFTPFYCGIDLAISFCGSDDDDLDIFAHPPILTPIAFEAITEEGLPLSMQDSRWDRIFSSCDGTSFLQFMRCVRGRDNTLFVAKTSCGKIVGGFATGLWSGHRTQHFPDDNVDKEEFLFVVEPMTPKAPKSQVVASTFIPGLDFHGRTPTANHFSFQRGRNNEKIPHRVNIFKSARRMKQTCRIGGKCISMSKDDGSLSLELNNSFKSGTWRIDGNEEKFNVLEFEVYGFTEN